MYREKQRKESYSPFFVFTIINITLRKLKNFVWKLLNAACIG